MIGDAIPSRGSVVGLLQALRKLEVGTSGSIKDLRHAFAILLFTHAATTTVEVDNDNAAAFVVREYASLAYYLRQHHSLLQIADGVDAVIDHCIQSKDVQDNDFLSILRVLLALSGGDSGRSFADTRLGPHVLQLLLQQHPSQCYNRRMGEYVVQSNAALANTPHALFHMHDTVSHRDAKDMLDAMSALPGHSALQSDFWHEKDTIKPADLFGALQHSAFHRTDAQLIRFDLHLSVPPLYDTPPDLVSNALSANKHLPRRQRMLSDTTAPVRVEKPRQDNPRDCNLLFSTHKTIVDVDLPSSTVSKTHPKTTGESSLLQVWENLGPKKVYVENRSMLGGCLHGDNAHASASSSDVAAVTEVALVAGILEVLHGIESAFFQRRGFDFYHTTASLLRTTTRIDVANFVQVFARTGTLVHRLSVLATHFGQHGTRGGRVLQRMGNALQYFLAGQHAFVLERKADTRTLVKVWTATSTVRRRLQVVAMLFMCDDDDLWVENQAIMSMLPTGVGMLNRVYHAIVRSQFCDPAAAAISMWFFVQLSEPYFQALTQWIYLGESTDEDVEFAHDGMFDTLDCLQHDEALIRAISETGALLRVTRTVQSHLYYLSSSKWASLHLVTDHEGIERYLEQHASNLQMCRSAVEKYADDKMQALADSIFALQMSSSPVEKSMQSNAHENARAYDGMQREMKRLRQQLQRKLLDEQIAEQSELRVQQQAQQLLMDQELERKQSVAAQEKADRDKARLLEIYEGLMAEADRKHRRALWRKARVERSESFKAALTNLYRDESSAWYAAARIDLARNPQADPMHRKPTSRQLHRGIDSSATELLQLDQTDHDNSIRVLQAPGGNANSERHQKHSVRVLKQPGGDSHALENSTCSFSVDGAANPHSTSVRVLKAPGGGGSDAACAIYSQESKLGVEYTTRVTQKLGGSGAAASNAIYHGDELENSCSAPQVRLRQQPGGNSDGAENAIYGGKVDGNTEHKVVSSVRVMQEPGGSGSAVSSLLYPTDNEASADAHVTHIKVLQEPGGDGSSASDLLYGRTHEHEPARRPSVRVSHPPGGDGDALGDTLYAQFANLGVHSRPSVKVLAPSGGGIDSVSSLVFRVHEDTPKKQVADPNNNITIEWTVAQEGPSQPTRLLEQDVFAPTHLTSDYAHVLETYRQLMVMDNTMEYAPVETLVRVSMTGPVLNQRAFVGTVALNVLREHVHLMQHLGTLHDVMLLSGGLWVDRFMQEFILGLDTASRVNWGVPGALNDLLANALDEANFHVTESTALFAFRPTDELETILGDPTMAPSLDQVLLHIDPVYALPSVLVDVVVSKSTLQQYAVLHKHLFQLKAIALSLQSVRRILTAHPTVATRSGHLRAHVDHHLCTTLVAHSFQSIADEWHRFTRKADACQDAAAFKHLHDNYINAVSTRCFLDRPSHEVQLAIQACLHHIMRGVELIQNNATRPVALKRVLEHLATTTHGDFTDLCSTLERDSSPAAQDLLLHLDFDGSYRVGNQAM
ncbi:hypothetical protein H310_06347 [Aphanomyces invadans]|uniref:Uncharacterized protein n=1 Tax=Aphanomyces invadans TaxID=157072 RepID=A0A024U772_9STRA|nr:hypothetical protein H310_06347 [Aphanomyces invadans]ETW01742.1 hypothetical protein H310_06347 [Aphanomyces invadans]|eukprot:XP_008869590.1 hypothetical protein H310_06347 [Aphanomyces invadans]